MNYMLWIALFCFAVGGMFSMQRQVQMLQQNSYYPSRYFKWLQSSASFTTLFSAVFALLCITLLLVNATTFLPVLAAGGLVVRILRQQATHKASIKKLVYTNRVKRLLVSASVLFLLLGLLSALLPGISGRLLGAILVICAHFPQLIMLTALWINRPIESTINNGFLRDAKQILARNPSLHIIGVTGSYGKTSVKFMLNRILSEGYNVTATPESFNTPMGVIRTVRERLQPQTEVFIAEMGAKNVGDIKELCDLCDPTLGVITAVGPQHLETFGSVEQVAKTKFELADHCLKKENGKIYVNFDSQPAADYAKTLPQDKIVSFGTNSDLDCYAEDISYTPQGTAFTAVYHGERLPLFCKLLGRHSVTNLLGAVTMALDLGVSAKQIRFATSALKPAPHRLELKPFLNGAVLIDDAYNSNPEGCLEAVRVLGSFQGMRRILVTPGLVELGEAEFECNKTLGKNAADYCDDIILVGQKRAIPLAEGVKETSFDTAHLSIVDRFADAMKLLQNMTDRNTVVLFENDLPDNYAG